METNVHGNLHSLNGGAWDCHYDFEALSEANPYMFPKKILNFIAVDSFNAWFKYSTGTVRGLHSPHLASPRIGCDRIGSDRSSTPLIRCVQINRPSIADHQTRASANIAAHQYNWSSCIQHGKDANWPCDLDDLSCGEITSYVDFTEGGGYTDEEIWDIGRDILLFYSSSYQVGTRIFMRQGLNFGDL